MNPVLIREKAELAAFLGKYPQFNYYHLGDLGVHYWPFTTWYAYKEAGEILAVILFYTGMQPPILLAIANHNLEHMQALAKSISPFLPSKFYAHLSPGLEDIYQDTYHLTHHGEHYKMVLTDLAKLDEVGTSNVQSLSIQDLPELQDFYAISYPYNWFDARMLETGLYTGIRKNNKLLGVAGVHTYSPEYKAVAIGNITTHPDHRNQGIGAAVTAGLCKKLLDTVDTIGLNVKSDNAAAIAVYKNLGFEVVAAYHEYMAELKSHLQADTYTKPDN